MSMNREQVTRLEGGRSTWPVMVRLALKGLRSRASARWFFWLCVAAAAGFAFYQVEIGFYCMLFAAIWYYLSIRWVDQHGGWNVSPALAFVPPVPAYVPSAAAYPVAGSNPSRDVTSTAAYSRAAAAYAELGLSPSREVPPAAPSAPSGLSFVPFTDPTVGGFTLDVPSGWQVRGGQYQPVLGDRRWFVETQSPVGITVLLGDSNCPQNFCHNLMAAKDVMIAYPEGCSFLNIPPQAIQLASYYLKDVAPQRFGPLTITGQRDRDDMAQAELNRFRQLNKAVGNPLSASLKMSAHEIRFEAGGQTGCCLALCWYDPAYAALGLTPSQGTVYVYLAPPAMTAVAEQVLTQMRSSYRITRRMLDVGQQVDNQIKLGGDAVNRDQKTWFQGVQELHNAQVAQGSVFVTDYWQQQRYNENITHRFSDSQHTNDPLQGWSDMMRDQQRLVDPETGQTHNAAADHNYYWLDQQSGQVKGTDTSDPPDYQRSYTALRKL